MADATPGAPAPKRPALNIFADISGLPPGLPGINNIYSLAPERSNLDAAINRLELCLDQLSAMLVVVYGEGGKAFNLYNPYIRDNYMAACSNLADECRDLFSIVAREVQK